MAPRLQSDSGHTYILNKQKHNLANYQRSHNYDSDQDIHMHLRTFIKLYFNGSHAPTTLLLVRILLGPFSRTHVKLLLLE